MTGAATELSRPPARHATSAERVRACRQRRKDRTRCVMVKISDDQVDMLICMGWLAADDRDDRTAAAAGVTRMLSRVASVETVRRMVARLTGAGGPTNSAHRSAGTHDV
jgi:hypothetical protein